MSFRILLSLAFLSFLALTGCVHLAEHPQAAGGVVGRRFEVRQDLLAYGIKRSLPSSHYDYVVLHPKPGIGGPEVVDLGLVPAGTTLEVVELVGLGPRIFGREFYRVRLQGSAAARFEGRDLRLASRRTFHVGSDAEGHPILNPAYFRKL